jgi:hypothetical protein
MRLYVPRHCGWVATQKFWACSVALWNVWGGCPPSSAYVVLVFALQRISSICFHKKKIVLLTTHRFWLFKYIFQNETTAGSPFLEKNNNRKKLWVLNISKTSKKQWFSWKNQIGRVIVARGISPGQKW